MELATALLGGGGGGGGFNLNQALFDVWGTSAQNKTNAHEARLTRSRASKEGQKQRDWEEKMSNTALQRYREDAEAAGINPILAMTEGGTASTPAGASGASSAQSQASGKMGLSESMLTGLAMKKAKEEIKNIQETTKNTAANTRKTIVETKEKNPRGTMGSIMDNLLKGQTPEARKKRKEENEKKWNKLRNNPVNKFLNKPVFKKK